VCLFFFRWSTASSPSPYSSGVSRALVFSTSRKGLRNETVFFSRHSAPLVFSWSLNAPLKNLRGQKKFLGRFFFLPVQGIPSFFPFLTASALPSAFAVLTSNLLFEGSSRPFDGHEKRFFFQAADPPSRQGAAFFPIVGVFPWTAGRSPFMPLCEKSCFFF